MTTAARDSGVSHRDRRGCESTTAASRGEGPTPRD